ncbi:MAG: hypothetical protein JW741_13900 [Sedimentisphaerales bacterium]|nr:hypothetical protein [Sedimentisphaerales bacterium]
MTESRIEITERLRAAGFWGEASRCGDDIRRKLRAEKVPQAEANERSWQEMATKYPPGPVVEATPALPRAEAAAIVDVWVWRFGLTIPDHALGALVEEILAAIIQACGGKPCRVGRRG